MASNLLTFVFLLNPKEEPIALQYFLLKSPNLFFISKVPQNKFHSNIENTKIFQYLTPISTIIGSNDMPFNPDNHIGWATFALCPLHQLTRFSLANVLGSSFVDLLMCHSLNFEYYGIFVMIFLMVMQENFDPNKTIFF